MKKNLGVRNEQGAALVEAALLIALLAIIAVPSIKVLGAIPGKAVCGYARDGFYQVDLYYVNGHCNTDILGLDSPFF